MFKTIFNFFKRNKQRYVVYFRKEILCYTKSKEEAEIEIRNCYNDAIVQHRHKNIKPSGRVFKNFRSNFRIKKC